MVLSHIGIVNISEEEAVRFYAGFLGFEKTREFLVSAELSEQIFSVSREIKVLVFEKEGAKLEAFICPECRLPSPDFSHFGLLVDDLKAIREKARGWAVDFIEGRSGEKVVHFLKDFSGNLIEIKAR
jgi:methylmalonyl-CoA/ethylmalonyl-CoA epimerase